MIGDIFNSFTNAANGFLNAAGSVYSTIQGRKNTKDTIAANKELAEYAYARDLEMWERQNAYNSPQAQMERLKAAGLNPNLVYGTGAVANNSGPTPKYNTPNVDYTSRPPVVDMPAILSAFNDFQLKQAQIDNVKASTDAKMVATGIKAAWGAKLAQLGFDRGSWDLKMRQQMDPDKAGILSNQAQASNALIEQAKLKTINMMKQGALMDATKRNLDYTAIYNKYRAQWASMGFTSSDNIGFRMLATWMAQSGINLFDAAKQVGKSIDW